MYLITPNSALNKNRKYRMFSLYVSYTGHILLVSGSLWHMCHLHVHQQCYWKCTVGLTSVETSLSWCCVLMFIFCWWFCLQTPDSLLLFSESSFGPSFWGLLPMTQADTTSRDWCRQAGECSDVINLTLNKENRLWHRGFIWHGDC